MSYLHICSTYCSAGHTVKKKMLVKFTWLSIYTYFIYPILRNVRITWSGAQNNTQTHPQSLWCTKCCFVLNSKAWCKEPWVLLIKNHGSFFFYFFFFSISKVIRHTTEDCCFSWLAGIFQIPKISVPSWNEKLCFPNSRVNLVFTSWPNPQWGQGLIYLFFFYTNIKVWNSFLIIHKNRNTC